MTISAVWRLGDHAYMCSDTTESGRADTPFPMSSFDEAASASDLNAQERAMKLVQVGTHGIATASGDGRVARRIMDQIDAMTPAELARGVEAALGLAADRAGLTALEAGYARWLCAEWRDGRLSTLCWPDAAADSTGPGRRNAAALLSGNLSNDLADGFCYAGAQALAGIQHQRDAGASLPPTAELSMISAAFQAFIVAEGLSAARGIGGAVVAARVGPDGVRWMPDTLYVIANPDLVSRVASGNGERVDLSDLASFVVCLSVREGCLFLRSTGTGASRVLVPGDEKRAAYRWRSRWESAVQEPAFWCRCQTIVFVNFVQRTVTTVFGDFTQPNHILGLSVDGTNGALAADWRAGLVPHLLDVGEREGPWKVHVDVVAPFRLPINVG
jgi:hypothetical protein